MTYKNYTFCFFISLFFAGCSVNNSTLKKGTQLEATGNFKQATTLYLDVLQRKQNLPEIQNALQKSSQIYLAEVQNTIAMLHEKGDKQGVVTSFFELNSFLTEVAKFNKNIEIDATTKNIYVQNLEVYLTEEYEKGVQLLGTQNFSAAATSFTTILRYNSDYKDTKKLLNTAKNEPFYLEGIRFFNEKKYILAYNSWKSILATDGNYKDVNNKMKQALSERYKEGSLALMQERFEEAAMAFGEIRKIDSNYSDVKQRYTEAVAEPLFRNAVALLRQNKCRTAFGEFENLKTISSSYKNAMELQNEALQCASFPIVIEAFGPRNANGFEASIQDAVIESILEQKDPFLKINKGRNESRSPYFNNSNTMNRLQLENYITSTYNNNPIKAVLTIHVNQYRIVENPPIATDKKGIEVQKFIKKNGLDSLVQKEVVYKEFEKSTSLQTDITYRLVSVANGQILLQKTIQKNEKEQAKYARSNANNVLAIYPTKRFMNEFVKDDFNYKNLQNLFQQSDVLSLDAKKWALLEQIQQQITNEILQFNPEN